MERKYEQRVELHCHTAYSRMDSVVHESSILRFLEGQRMDTVAITDFNNVSGFSQMQYNLYQNRSKAKVIYGMEALVTEDRPEYEACAKQHHVMLLVKNQQGVKDLYHLVTAANMRKKSGQPVFIMSEVLEHRENLLLGCSCENSLLWKVFAGEGNQNKQEEIAAMYDYLELCPQTNAADTMEYQQKVISLGEKLGIPVVAVSNVHFMRPEEIIGYEILLRENEKVHFVPEHMKKTTGYEKQFFHTTEEMLEAFSHLGEKKAYEIVVENTNKIADSIEKVKSIIQAKFRLHSTPEDDARLEALCLEGLEKKYRKKTEGMQEAEAKELMDRANARMLLELSMIKENGYSYYFLLFYDLIHNNGLQPSQYCLRGCGAGAIVSYLLDVSQVDPLKEGRLLYHEFMIGFMGEKGPDIDINVDEKVWNKVQKSAKDLHGVKACYGVISPGRMTDWTAEHWVKKYEEEYGPLTEEQRNIAMRGCSNVISEADHFHPGGVMLIPEGVDEGEYVPFDMVPETGEKYIPFEYHTIDILFEKIDILPHSNCTLNGRMLEETGYAPTDEDLEKLFEKPKDDNAKKSEAANDSQVTYSEDDPEFMAARVEKYGEMADARLWAEGERIADMLEKIPGFDRKFISQLIHQVHPRNIADLVKVECLCHGTGTWLDNGDMLFLQHRYTLQELIACREDVFEDMMKFGMDGSLAYEMAEYVRKGRMNRPTQLRKKLIEVMEEYGVPEQYIRSCCRIMYLFPRAHSAEYVKMELRALYYRINYPEIYDRVYTEIYGPERGRKHQ